MVMPIAASAQQVATAASSGVYPPVVCRSTARRLISSLVLDWLIRPAVMFALAWLLLPVQPAYGQRGVGQPVARAWTGPRRAAGNGRLPAGPCLTGARLDDQPPHTQPAPCVPPWLGRPLTHRQATPAAQALTCGNPLAVGTAGSNRRPLAPRQPTRFRELAWDER
ncbi:hypothetical protein C7C45_28410 [Micromonospora arborensis]|uniref:Uncharacterized protein n=1 Tax=Micromonospora arborensis TaxID=2116518 RepID=A0A318NFU5_9ACTN|nr:hypothetical protein C7C45_28410 [Micromonospora arborensis]